MLDKVSYSKSSCLRFIFCKQLIKYSVSVIILKNSNYRRKNSHTITICSWCPSHLILFIPVVCRCFLYKALPSWKSNQLHWALLTFTFLWDNLSAKNFFGKLVRYIFKTCRQNRSQIGKNYAHSKVTIMVLISEICLYSILEEQIAVRNSKSYVVGF